MHRAVLYTMHVLDYSNTLQLSNTQEKNHQSNFPLSKVLCEILF